jgi:hypothetical protein
LYADAIFDEPLLSSRQEGVATGCFVYIVELEEEEKVINVRKRWTRRSRVD